MSHEPHEPGTNADAADRTSGPGPLPPLPVEELPGPSPIAEALADLIEATLVAGRPFAAPRTDSAPPAPPARIALDRDDRRLLLEAHERVLHGDLSVLAAEPHLASLVRALAQVILDQEAVA